jgi:DNA polymerase-3 subunit delta'
MLYPWLDDTWNNYHSALSKQRLHHGILIMGAVGLGKGELAYAMANHLLCAELSSQRQACGKCKSCLLFAAKTHPDLQHIVPEKSIGVDLVRQAINKLNSSAQLSGNKVLVIENAEFMTEAAANALLKTLEEPTAKTFILLTSSDQQKLLPTILSRCSKLLVATPNIDVATTWLLQQTQQNVDPQTLKAVGGSPLRALQVIDKIGESYPRFMQAFKAMLMNQTSVKQFVESELQENEYGLKWLQQWLLQRSRKDANYLKLLQSCQKSVASLQRTGVNKVLVLSSLCTEIKRTLVTDA